jgi:hypothetical protein
MHQGYSMKKICNLSAIVIYFLMNPAFLAGQGVILPSGIYAYITNGTMVLQGNWVNNGSFASTSSTFIIAGTTTVSGSTTPTFGSIQINTGTTLTGPSAGTMNLNGNFTNNGTFNHNGGTLVFSGTTQNLGGTTPTLFSNLTIGTGSTTTIATAGQTLQQTLLCNGTLNAGGNLTLLSTSSQTALIDGSGTGQVLGNINLQRYINSAFGYKYFSTPFQSATVGQFSSYVNLSASFPAFYRYDENQQSSGWISYTATSNAMIPTQAYSANLGTSKSVITISLTGVVNNGTQAAATLYNHNNPYTQGFNLVGNPYPSPVDWNAGSGWTRTNIDNAIYYFDASDTNQYSGTYSSYINGVSSNGIANNIIPAMQGFFIHVSNGTYPVTGTLVFNNGVRVNNFNPAFHKSEEYEPKPLIRLTAGLTEKDSEQDAVTVYLEDSATPAFDKEFDALKMMNTDDLVPNIYALSSDAQRLSISAIPTLHDSLTRIPLGLKTARDGIITFNALAIDLIPEETHIYLQDRQAGIYHDLRINPKYSSYLPAGVNEDRFALVMSLKDMKDNTFSDNEFYVFSSGGKLFVNLNLASDNGGDLLLYDLLGRNLLQTTLRGNGRHEIDLSLNTGIYIVCFLSDTGMHSKKVFISNL